MTSWFKILVQLLVVGLAASVSYIVNRRYDTLVVVIVLTGIVSWWALSLADKYIRGFRAESRYRALHKE